MKNLLIILLLSPLFCFSQLESTNNDSLYNKTDSIGNIEIQKIDSIPKHKEVKIIKQIEHKSLNFRKEEWILAIFSIIISALISLLLVLRQKTQIASFHSDEENCFYFEYKNGFGQKFYSKRGVSENYEQKVKKSEFLKIKSDLVRRVIP